MGAPRKYPSIQEKFFVSFVKEASGCWKWIGAKSTCKPYPYGALTYLHKIYRAHRWSYEYFKGPIPEGLVLDHLCRNTLCVNPDHLEPVTTKENVLRGVSFAAINATKTHCLYGHEFTSQNTYFDKRGFRYCRECRKVASKLAYQKLKTKDKEG